MTASQLASLKELIASGQEHSFYLWGAWKQKCREVKALDHNECQACKAKGRYRRGELVHHVKHLRDRPDLALSIWDPATETVSWYCCVRHATDANIRRVCGSSPWYVLL